MITTNGCSLSTDSIIKKQTATKIVDEPINIGFKSYNQIPDQLDDLAHQQMIWVDEMTDLIDLIGRLDG